MYRTSTVLGEHVIQTGVVRTCGETMLFRQVWGEHVGRPCYSDRCGENMWGEHVIQTGPSCLTKGYSQNCFMQITFETRKRNTRLRILRQRRFSEGYACLNVEVIPGVSVVGLLTIEELHWARQFGEWLLRTLCTNNPLL